MAFNQHIAKELTGRLPPSVPACTLHSLGFAAVRRSLPNAVIDEQKLTKLAKSLAPDAYPSTRQAAEQLARLCKYTLTPERDEAGLRNLVDHYGVEVDWRDRERVRKLAGDLVEQSAQQIGTVDFDDQVWLPTRLGLPVDQHDLLLVDEAQDLSRMQQTLALAAVQSGRLCPIGDRHQAIYGFTGADNDALPRLAGQLQASDRSCRVLPLTVTWRCPALHVELARQLVPALEAAPGAVEGELWVMSRREIAKEVRPGDLVICRKNSPCVDLTYRLVMTGVPAVMRGREIGRGLLTLIARLRPDTLDQLIFRIEDYREKEEVRLQRRDAPASAYESLTDRCDCLSKLTTQARDLQDLEAFIRRTFDDAAQPGSSVVLSSIHRAKGLEAERVFVLDPSSLPLIRRDSKAWERQQEKNLCYIAATRSKRVLIFEDHLPSIFRS